MKNRLETVGACDEKVFCLSKSERLPVCQRFDERPPHSALPLQQTSPLQRYKANAILVFLYQCCLSVWWLSKRTSMTLWTAYLVCSWPPSILISTPAWLSYLGSLWARRENSSRLTQKRPICACVPPKKKPSSAIITLLPFQRYRRHAMCKNRLQEIGLILIWPNYQGRKWASE